MKASRVHGLLLVVNLALLAAVAYFVIVRSRPSASPAPASVSAGTSLTGQNGSRSAGEAMGVTNDFRWEQLESEDYRTYIERLRSIGCPEQTIRDIIIADLDKLLAPRVQAVSGRRKDLKYWHSEEEELLNNHDYRDRLRQEREIDREKRQIVQELLGADLLRERMKTQGRTDYYERRLSFLPEEKRSQVRGILEKYDAQELAVRQKEWEEGEVLNAADREQLRQLRQLRQGELASALSPEELRQYELWLSPTANAVRHACYGMDVTEEEFLAMYELRRAFDDAWAQVDFEMLDESQQAQWEQARLEMDAQVRARLGDARFAEYKRGEDPDFHHLNATVSRYKLPRERATEVYELKKAVQEMTAEVRANPTLSSEQKEAALAAVYEETERTVRQMLGDRPFRYYRQRAHWLGK